MMEERRQDERISLRSYVEALFNHYKDAHAREHILQAESIKLARENMEYRLEGLNKWREQLQAERGDFVSAEKFDATSLSTDRRLNLLDKQVANLVGKMIGAGVVITFILSALALALRFLP